MNSTLWCKMQDAFWCKMQLIKEGALLEKVLVVPQIKCDTCFNCNFSIQLLNTKGSIQPVYWAWANAALHISALSKPYGHTLAF